jgi:hypothetical protein
MMKKIFIGCLAVGMVACAPISKTAKEDLAQPVNCATAEGDLRALESEKAHVAEEIAAGVQAIVPIGLVINVVTLREVDQLKVATGEYNRALDKKIAEIKQECGL